MLSDSGYSSSSSSSDSDMEDFSDLLKKVGLRKKYEKMFTKAGIEEVDDAEKLTDSKLKKIGVASSTERKKILKAVAEALESDSSSSGSDSDTSSSDSSEDDMSEVEKKLKKAGLSKHFRALRKNKVTTLRSASKLSDAKLKQFGFESSRLRQKILQLFVKAKTKTSNTKQASRSGQSKKARRNSGSTHSSQSFSSSSTSSSKKVNEKEVILKVLRDVGLETLGMKFFEHGVKTIKAASKVSVSTLKSIGLDGLSVRSRVLSAFQLETLQEARDDMSRSSAKKSSKKSKSSDDEESTDPIYVALKRVNMQKHFKLFQKAKVSSVRQAQELDDDKLLDIGVENAGQRALIMEGIQEADWKCTYCTTWNEHRKTCVVCQKTFRKQIVLEDDDDSDNKIFELNDKVKYTGRYRPGTKTSSGAKGEIHRVLENGEFYMVNFQQKDGKSLKIRLNKSELAPMKKSKKKK